MKKKILSISLALLTSQSLAFADDTLTTNKLISDNQGNAVTQLDLDNLLDSGPVPSQLSFLRQKNEFNRNLERMYLVKVIAAQNKQVPLSAKEQVKLDNLIQTFYFQRKIEQLSTQNLPDFEPLAKLQYEARKSEFTQDAQTAAEHILIDTKKRSEKEALKLANKLIADIKKGADFSQLAEKYSDDPSVKDNQGKLGFFGKGRMVQPFEDAAKALKLNEISKPVKTQFGYHIIRKYDEKAEGLRDYKDVKEELINKVKHDFVQTRIEEFYESIKKDNGMQLNAGEVDRYITDRTQQLKKSTSTAAPK